VGYRFTGVLYEVEPPRPFPFLHLAPRGWPTYPGERWPFLLALLGLLGVLLALLARHFSGLPVLKPGTSPLLLLAFPALYLYLFAAWRVATRGIGPEVALEGELARRFRAWGSWDSIGEDAPLGRVLLRARKVLGPFWLRVEDGKLYLAFPGGSFGVQGPQRGSLPTSPFLIPQSGPGAVGGEAQGGDGGPRGATPGPRLGRGRRWPRGGFLRQEGRGGTHGLEA
jgi:hypothetical protein